MAHLGTPIALGSRSVVYEWGRDAVAKVPLAATPEGWIRYEAQFTHSVYLSGAPVPKVLGVETINGREVSIFERIRGTSMWDALIAAPVRASELGRELAEVHRKVLAIVPPISLPSQYSRLLCKIEVAAKRFDSSLLAVAHAVKPAMSNHLCHGDFHPKNVLLTEQGPVVVDWFDVSRGDELSDVARSSLLLTTGSHLDGSTTRSLAEFHESYLGTMNALMTFTLDDLARWREIHAAARLSEGVDEETLLEVLGLNVARQPAVGTPSFVQA